jgi:hypothetical protein
MIRALEAAGLAWLMFNGARFVSMNLEDALQLSRKTIDRFKRAIGVLWRVTEKQQRPGDAVVEA